MNLPYDQTSAQSILDYARLLLGKTLKEVHPEATTQNVGLGRLGIAVEKYHFCNMPNSNAEPDFLEAGIELKCTPLKLLNDGSTVAKERLVLNVINYMEEADKTFETSSFWHKNKLLLLMFYLHESGIDVVDLLFKIIRLWEFPEVDLKIIRDDWSKIHWKLANGYAHEISEGDTLYLAACCKGSRAGAELRAQVGSNILAQQRAYSIKPRYMNTIIMESLLHDEMCHGVHLSAAQKRKIKKSVEEARNIVQSIDEYEENETFEQLIERRFRPYYGKTIYTIERMLSMEFSKSPKAISNDVIRGILGVREKKKIREFEMANIQQKSIRLEANGNLKESMVFSQIKYDEIVNEEIFEESAIYDIFTQRFLFIVFRKSDSGDDKMAKLEKVFFWTMPSADLAVARNYWKDTRDKIRDGVFDDFWKASDEKICHVRPKAKNSEDKADTPYGPQLKRGYWLNRSYILDIVKKNL